MRTLRPLGARVFAPATLGTSLWKLSRHCAGLLQIGENGSPSTSDPNRTVEELLNAGRAIGGEAVLLPCSDEWALFVARYKDRLASVYRVATLGHDLARQLGDKQALHELATEHGVASPATVRPADRVEAIRLAPTLDYPVVIKSAISRAANQMAFASDPDELVAAFDRLGDPGNLICQRLLPGRESGGWLFNGYFDASGRCVAGFSGRKLRQWPAGRGITVLAEATRNGEVEETAIRFLTAIGYRGAVDVDFLQDPANGRYNILDVNPRLGGVFRLFEDRRGLDVARAMYLDLIGEPAEQEGQRTNRRIVVEGGFFVATLKSWRERLSNPAATWREVGGAEMATFRLSDPLPFAVHMAGTIKIHAAVRVRRYWRPRNRSRRGIPAQQETPAV
jgi:predicted ATP-grasp superfamily ATP-dependent carboligase